MDYAQTIKAKRLERGLSVAEVAEETGVREVTIHAVEEGRYRPTLDLAIRVARVLDTTLNDITGIA